MLRCMNDERCVVNEARIKITACCCVQAPNFREAAALMHGQDLPTPVVFGKYDDGDDYNRRLRAGAPDVYNYTAYPALLVFKEGKHERYLCGRETHELVDYMTYVSKGLDPIEEEKKSKPGLYKREPDFDPLLMAELDTDNFEEEVLENENVVWIIEFYSDHCPICKSLAPEIIKAARQVLVLLLAPILLVEVLLLASRWRRRSSRRRAR